MHQPVDPHADQDENGRTCAMLNPFARTAHSCRWAAPTLFMAFPHWLESEDWPWSCLNPREPHRLESTDACRTCPEWEPRPVEHR